jgi:hypothetical protein
VYIIDKGYYNEEFMKKVDTLETHKRTMHNAYKLIYLWKKGKQDVKVVIYKPLIFAMICRLNLIRTIRDQCSNYSKASINYASNLTSYEIIKLNLG